MKKNNLGNLKRRVTLALYWLYGFYLLMMRFISPSDQFRLLTADYELNLLFLNFFLFVALFFFSIFILAKWKAFGFTKSQNHALMPFALQIVFFLLFLFVPLESLYLQLEQGHLQSDRNEVIKWLESLDIQQSDSPVSYTLPEQYAYLSLDGKVRVIRDDYYFMVEFKTEGTLEDYEQVVYVDQDDLRAPAQYFGTTYGGIKIVRCWFWYD